MNVAHKSTARPTLSVKCMSLVVDAVAQVSGTKHQRGCNQQAAALLRKLAAENEALKSDAARRDDPQVRFVAVVEESISAIKQGEKQ